MRDVHNQLKVDQGFFAKLLGKGEEDRERDQERGTSGTSTRRGSAATGSR